MKASTRRRIQQACCDPSIARTVRSERSDNGNVVFVAYTEDTKVIYKDRLIEALVEAAHRAKMPDVNQPHTLVSPVRSVRGSFVTELRRLLDQTAGYSAPVCPFEIRRVLCETTSWHTPLTLSTDIRWGRNTVTPEDLAIINEGVGVARSRFLAGQTTPPIKHVLSQHGPASDTSPIILCSRCFQTFPRAQITEDPATKMMRCTTCTEERMNNIKTSAAPVVAPNEFIGLQRALGEMSLARTRTESLAVQAEEPVAALQKLALQLEGM